MRPFSRSAAIALVALGVALLSAPAGASAASCTATSVRVADNVADGKYLQPPEIASVTAAVDGACTLRLSDEIGNRPSGLTSRDWLFWWLDVDNSVTTGRTAGPTAGADYGVVLTGGGQAQLTDGYGAPIGP